MEVSGQRHDLALFTAGERTPGTHCIGGCVGLRFGQDTETRGKIICPRWESNSRRPVCSQDTILTELPQLLLAAYAYFKYTMASENSPA
jgi:hypothetical protein